MNFRLVGVGEVLWDMLESGPKLGGAPANFAYHSHALGAHSYVISRVGADDHGREIIRRFRSMGIRSGAIQIDEKAPTGTATVDLSGEGIAHFTIQENAAWDYISATPEALALVAGADAICFGTLAQRGTESRRTIRQLVAAAPPSSLRIFDINLRQNFYSREVIERSLDLANVMKLNDEELPVLSKMFALSGSTESQLQQLAAKFDLQMLALTRGANGSLLYRNAGATKVGAVRNAGTETRLDRSATADNDEWSECASKAIAVADTVGAGDSFTAAMALGLLRNLTLDEINAIANEVACYVCSQPGATPELPPDFAGRFGLDRNAP